MTLRPPALTLGVGEEATLALEGVWLRYGIEWRVSPELKLLDSDGSSAKIRGLREGEGRVTASVRGDELHAKVKVVSAGATGPIAFGDDIRLTGMVKALKLPDKQTRLLMLMYQVRTGKLDAKGFFKAMADLGADKDDLIAAKSTLEKHAASSGDLHMMNHILGRTTEQGGTQVEGVLYGWRKDTTLRLIQQTIRHFIDSGRIPRNGFSLMISHVGKWATQGPNAMTFAGDIDFSFVCNDTQLAEAMKAHFESLMVKESRLTPIQIDAVATVHGRAGLEVYIGRHGMQFAEMQMKDNFYVDLATGEQHAIGLEAMTGRLAMERSIADLQGIEVPRPTFDSEPGLSMEMVRHFDHDIVRSGVYGSLDSVLKAAKYLHRSNEALNKMNLSPGDASLATLAAVVHDLDRYENPPAEIRDLLLKVIAEHFGTELKAVWNGNTQRLVLDLDAAVIAKFHAQVKAAMWDNVMQGANARYDEISARQRDLFERQRKGELVAADAENLRTELVNLLDMMHAEIDAFGDQYVPELLKQKAAQVRTLLDQLAKRTGVRSLSLDELKDKKLVESLWKANSQQSKQMVLAYVMDRALKAAERAVSTGEQLNSILDTLDDRMLGELRGETGFAALEARLDEIRLAHAQGRAPTDMGNRLVDLRTQVKGAIATTNRKLNEALQATAAGRQGLKLMMVTGLIDEMKAYGNALWEGNYEAFAMEFFRRRVPLFSAAEHAYMGNTYMAMYDVLTTLVPPAALPEAAWGLGKAIGEHSRATYWSEQLALFSDGLYADAVFKLTEVQDHEGGKVGVYRLEATYYNKLKLDLHGFAAMRKEQVEELRRTVNSGHIDWRAYKDKFTGFTEWLDVSETLRMNLTANDPALIALEEMITHQAVGEKFKTRMAELGLARWEEIKLGYIVNLIDHLEKRKQAESALERGVLPDLFAELRAVAVELDIEKQVLAGLDAEVDTSNYKALVNWLWQAKRDLAGQAATESEIDRAAQTVLHYLEVYKQIRELRYRAIESLPPKFRSDGGSEYLKGDLFFSGRADADLKTAQHWAAWVDGAREAVTKEMLAVKHEFLPDSRLETKEEEAFLARAWQQELWMKPFQTAGANRQSTALLDRAISHGKRRNAVFDEYRESLQAMGPVQLTLLLSDADDSKRQVARAQVDAKPTDDIGIAAQAFGDGKLVIDLAKGNYRLTVRAPGYKPHTFDDVFGNNLDKAPSREVALQPGDDMADPEIAEDEQADASALSSASIRVEAPAELIVGESATLEASIVGIDATAAQGLQIEWLDTQAAGRLLGKGPSLTFKGDKPGRQRLSVRVTGHDAAGKTVERLRSEFELTVQPKPEVTVKIDGPARTSPGYNVGLQALLEGDNQPDPRKLRFVWGNGLGEGPTAYLENIRPGITEARVEVYLKTDQGERRIGWATHRIAVPNDVLPVPAEVMEGEVLTLTAPPQPVLGGEVKSYTWYGGDLYDEEKQKWGAWNRPNQEQVKTSFRIHKLEQGRKPRLTTVSVSYLDGEGQTLATAKGQFQLVPAYLVGSASDVWKGGARDKSFKLNRDRAQHAGGKASVGAALSVSVDSVSASLDEPAELAAYAAEDARRTHRVVKPFSVGPFKGYIVEHAELRKRRGGGHPMTGYHNSSASRELHGWLVSGSTLLKLHLSAHGSGSVDNSDYSWVVSKAGAAYDEGRGILSGLTFAPDKSFAFEPYKGPALDGSEDPEPLTLTLSAPQTPLQVGQTVAIEAQVGGGKAPYGYSWEGDHAGDGARVTVVGARPGEHRLSLQVSSADGQSATADVSYRVDGIGARIAGLPASVAYGSQHAINVALPPQLKSASVIWQAEPNVTFDPVESSDGKTRVLFDRAPEDGVKIWAQVIDAGSTIGEADQVTVKVTPPRLSLRFDPVGQKVGQEVLASVELAEPLPTELIDFRWIEPAPAMRQHEGENDQRVRFVPQDTRPLAFEVRARVPGVGDELGELTASYTAVPYRVSAKVVESGLQPRIWKPGVGLVDAPRGTHATGQRISVSADIADHPKVSDVRWQWSANEGTQLSNPSSRTPTLTRSEPGEVALQVVASDSKGIRLGDASLSFSVAAASEAVAKAAPPPKAADDEASAPAGEDGITSGMPQTTQADVLLEEATSHARRGDLQQAAVAIEQARQLDSGRAAELGRELAAAVLRDAQDAERAWDFDRSGELFGIAHRFDPYDVASLQGRGRADDYRKREAQVIAWRRDAGAALDNQDLEAAEARLKDVALWEDIMPKGDGERPETATLRVRYDKVQQSYEKDMQKFKEQIGKLQQAGKHDQVVSKARERLQQKPLRSDERNWLQGLLQVGAPAPSVPAQPVTPVPAGEQVVEQATPTQADAKPPVAATAAQSSDPSPATAAPATAAARVEGNQEQLITLNNLDLPATDVLRLLITQPSGRTASGKGDSARIGEVEFYRQGERVMPVAVTAESVYGGYAAEQASDGDRTYRYRSEGAVGWASSNKSAGESTWIEFRFAQPVALDRVVVTTAPSNPYRLHSFELLTLGAAAVKASGSGTGFDFESGTLDGWTRTGDAFDSQPTFGDNPTARNRGQASNHQGDYWIGTYENRPGASAPAGQIQGDGPQGTLTSAPFSITSPSIDFLVGGGCNIDVARVELLVDGQVVRKATGKCNETLQRERWDVSDLQGRTAQLRLVDASGGGWGHINFDDLRLGTPGGTAAAAPTAVDISGLWQLGSSNLTLQVQGDKVEGTYDSDGGRISGTLRDGVFEGIWSENNSGRRCVEQRHDRYHWGRVRWVFEADRFTGSWGYCEDEPSKAWNGKRP